MMRIQDRLYPEDASELRRVLMENKIGFSDEVDLSKYEGRDPFETDDEEGPAVWHWEVGWSWWSSVQRLMSNTVGSDSVPHALHLHAWNGVAVPGEIEPQLIGETMAMSDKIAAELKERLESTDDEHEANVERLMCDLILKNGGPYANVCVASAPALLREMEVVIDRLGLDRSQMRARYEADPDDDNHEEIARCYLLVAREFVKQGSQNGHLIWFIK